jgi:hypothetical protein
MLGAEIDDADDERFQHVLPVTKPIRSGPYGMGGPLAAGLDDAQGDENRVQYHYSCDNHNCNAESAAHVLENRPVSAYHRLIRGHPSSPAGRNA